LVAFDGSEDGAGSGFGEGGRFKAIPILPGLRKRYLKENGAAHR
jgi:hypothetical protein